MRLNGYQCDDCGNIHNESSLPEGWISVEKKLKDNWRKFFYFCSIGCLSAWALKQKMEIKNEHDARSACTNRSTSI